MKKFFILFLLVSCRTAYTYVTLPDYCVHSTFKKQREIVKLNDEFFYYDVWNKNVRSSGLLRDTTNWKQNALKPWHYTPSKCNCR